MTKGWNAEKQSFVQYYGSDVVDASSLLMMITNFTGAKEPRMLSTIDRIQKELASGALVLRYNPKFAADDGLGSQEGTFGACSFWLIEDLARAGRLDEARVLWKNYSRTAIILVSMLKKFVPQARHWEISHKRLLILL